MKPYFIYLAVWVPLVCQAQNSRESTVPPNPGTSAIKTRPTPRRKSRSDLVRQRSELQRNYFKRHHSSYNNGGHLALITGIWIPTGAIRQVGAHPEIGFQLGGKRNGFEIDFSMIFKFLESPNYYPAMIMDSPGLTRHFFGGYIGIDFRKDFFHRGANEMSLLGGVGLDGWDVARPNIRTRSVLTHNFNIGLGYRHYNSSRSYFGINVKYNFVDYTVGHVVDFTGNPVTIHLTLGGLF